MVWKFKHFWWNYSKTALMSMRKTRISVLVIYWIIQHSIFLLKFKGHKMANIRNEGRPCRTITLNFNRVDDTVNEVLSLCSNEDTREIILSFCNEVRNTLVNPRENFVNKRCQTRHITADQIIDFLPNFKNHHIINPVHHMMYPVHHMMYPVHFIMYPIHHMMATPIHHMMDPKSSK